MSVTELETAIAGLSKQERSQLAKWFQEYMADEWDRQIEEDVKAGRLDHLLKQVDGDIDAGLSKPL
jgi:hypothetical protein